MPHWNSNLHHHVIRGPTVLMFRLRNRQHPCRARIQDVVDAVHDGCPDNGILPIESGNFPTCDFDIGLHRAVPLHLAQRQRRPSHNLILGRTSLVVHSLLLFLYTEQPAITHNEREIRIGFFPHLAIARGLPPDRGAPSSISACLHPSSLQPSLAGRAMVPTCGQPLAARQQATPPHQGGPPSTD